MAELRSGFQNERTALSDEEFLRDVGFDLRIGRLTLLIRTIVARACSVRPNMIHPSDSLTCLCSIMDWGHKSGWFWHVDYGAFDAGLFAYEFESHVSLGFRDSIGATFFDLYLPPFAGSTSLWKGPPPQTFGEWAYEAAKVMFEKFPSGWEEAVKWSDKS